MEEIVYAFTICKHGKKLTYLIVNLFLILEGAAGEWLAYKRKNNTVCVLNLRSSSTIHFENVDEYLFSNNGKTLICESKLDPTTQVVSLKKD